MEHVEISRDTINDLKEFIRDQDKAVEGRLKLWVLSSVVAYVISTLPIIFYLGGIYNEAESTNDILSSQQAELEQRGQWMQERERWEWQIEQWALTRGFAPPRYRRDPEADNPNEEH